MSSLSKSERLYNKKLFRYLKIRKRAKQKEVASIIVKSSLYRRKGYKGVYEALYQSIPELSRVFSKLARSVQTITRAYERFRVSIQKDIDRILTENNNP